MQRQIRAPSQVLRERGDDFLHRGDDLVAVAEVVEHDDAAARAADTDHFIDDFAVVRHGGDDVGRDDGIETTVGKFHGAGIHAMELHMRQTMHLRPLFRLAQHAFREVDPGNLAMPRVHRKGEACADADFENLLVRLHIQIADRRFAPFVKHLAENLIVDTGVRRVDPLNFLQIHESSESRMTWEWPCLLE